MRRNNGPHDGVGVTFEGENTPALPEGEAWVVIEDPPEPGENQRLERELTDKKYGWRVIDLTQGEIEERELNKPGVDQITIMSRLGDEKAQILEGLIGQLPVAARTSWNFSNQIRINHPLLQNAEIKGAILGTLKLTEAELVEILTPEEEL